MKTSKILRLAKAKLWDGNQTSLHAKTPYLCSALSRVEVKYKDHLRLLKVHRRIHKDLGGHLTVGAWLIEHYGYTPPSVVVQQVRHRWLDKLVQHYEAKGD